MTSYRQMYKAKVIVREGYDCNHEFKTRNEALKWVRQWLSGAGHERVLYANIFPVRSLA